MPLLQVSVITSDHVICMFMVMGAVILSAVGSTLIGLKHVCGNIVQWTLY